MDRMPNQQRIDLRPTAKAPMRAPTRFSPLVIVLAGLLLIAVSVAGYFYWQYRNSKPGVAETKETKVLVETIGALMLLPEGEDPTLATVTDREKLADQPFFQKSENGDKVLIYSQSGRAILYRPSQKKIVDVTAVNVAPPTNGTAPVAPAETPTAASPSTAPSTISTSIPVALYNGSPENGAATILEKQIKELYPDMTIPVRLNASKQYETSTVVDLTGKNSIIAQAFANLVHGSIGALPAGEKAPANADVLIIIGKKH